MTQSVQARSFVLVSLSSHIAIVINKQYWRILNCNTIVEKWPLGCIRTKQIWLALEKDFGFQQCSQDSIHEWILWRSGQKETWRRICILSLWNIWKWRNLNIFKGANLSCSEIIDRISVNLEALSQKTTKHKKIIPDLVSSDHTNFSTVLLSWVYADAGLSSWWTKSHVSPHTGTEDSTRIVRRKPSHF